jgi:hypothetical protein
LWIDSPTIFNLASQFSHIDHCVVLNFL